MLSVKSKVLPNQKRVTRINKLVQIYTVGTHCRKLIAAERPLDLDLRDPFHLSRLHKHVKKKKGTESKQQNYTTF